MNLIDVLEKNSEGKKGDKTFIFYDNKHYSFKNTLNLINQTCNFFLDLKLKKKDRISLILENSIEFVILYFASMKYGLIVNPSPTYLSRVEIIKNINTIRPKKIFCSTDIVFLKKSHEHGNKTFIIDNKFNFLEFIKNFSTKFKKIKINNENTAVLYYSSGSTGKPKLIKMSHRAILNSQKIQKKSTLMYSGERHLCILPLAHTSSLRSTLKFCLFNHRSIFLYKNYWSIKNNILNIIKKNKITFVQTVPSILSMMSVMYSNNINVQNKIKTMKFVACGSSYLSQEIANKFINIFNIPIVNIYGLSETCAISMTNYKDKNYTLNSVGKILPGIKYKILNKKNKKCRIGEPGELYVKTPAMFNGYQNQKINKSDLKKYFKTGDIFTADNKNYLNYIERKKNIIIKSGINISAKEIDDVILKSKFVNDTFTTSQSDLFHGEVPLCYIVPKQKDFDLAKLILFCKKRIGEFKVPAHFKIIKKIPRSPTGKIQYSLLES